MADAMSASQQKRRRETIRRWCCLSLRSGHEEPIGDSCRQTQLLELAIFFRVIPFPRLIYGREFEHGQPYGLIGALVHHEGPATHEVAAAEFLHNSSDVGSVLLHFSGIFDFANSYQE